MPNDASAVLMSEAAYLLDPTIELKDEDSKKRGKVLVALERHGWAPIRYNGGDLVCSPVNDTGYFGVAFINETTHEISIAHRGTVLSEPGNIAADVAILKSERPTEIISDANSFVDEVRRIRRILSQNEPNPYTLSQTGHSLGGFLAEYQAARFSHKLYYGGATTFESPGALPYIQRDELDTELQGQRVVRCFVNNPNLINTACEHYGRIMRIIDSGTEGTIRYEGMVGTPRKAAAVLRRHDETEKKLLDFKSLDTLNAALSTHESHSLERFAKCHFRDGNLVLFAEVDTWPVANNRLQYGSREVVYNPANEREMMFLNPGNDGVFAHVFCYAFNAMAFGGLVAQGVGAKLLWDVTYDQQTQLGVISVKHSRGSVTYKQSQRNSQVWSYLGMSAPTLSLTTGLAHNSYLPAPRPAHSAHARAVQEHTHRLRQ